MMKNKAKVGIFTVLVSLLVLVIVNLDLEGNSSKKRSTASIGNYEIQMTGSWRPYGENKTLWALSFVKGGIASKFFPGNIDFHFYLEINQYIRNKLLEHSETYKKYSWGTARRVNDSFFKKELKINSSSDLITFFVPEMNATINVLALENLDDIVSIKKIKEGVNHEQRLLE